MSIAVDGYKSHPDIMIFLIRYGSAITAAHTRYLIIFPARFSFIKSTIGYIANKRITATESFTVTAHTASIERPANTSALLLPASAVLPSAFMYSDAMPFVSALMPSASRRSIHLINIYKSVISAK